MIKLIIFDLDGVLVNARELHYEALNKALDTIDNKFVISRDEHLSTYDGLSTTKKLEMLTKSKGLSKDSHNIVWRLKQEKTVSIIDKFSPDFRVKDILRRLKDSGYEIACCTNSIRETAKLQLIRKGFMEYIDVLYTNQDVNKPKPHPEMYMKCMLRFGLSPKQTLIIEDSHHGRKGALESGGHLCAVKDCEDVTYEKINEHLEKHNKSVIIPKWQGGKMNVLIPMAGAGSRFEKVGYTFPKPLIEVNDKPMIQVVTENSHIHCTKISLRKI